MLCGHAITEGSSVWPRVGESDVATAVAFACAVGGAASAEIAYGPVVTV
jgi:hypothetical protein